MRIGIAEGMRLVREGLAVLLAQDHEVQIAWATGSEEELMGLLKSDHPDVLLLDQALPPRGGLSVLLRLFKHHPKTKVLVVTNTDREEELFSVMTAGAKGYLSKTATASSFLKAVRAVHNNELWLSRQSLATLFEELRSQVKPMVMPRLQMSRLTKREREVLLMLTKGWKNKDIADKLAISEKTIKSHLTSIFSKLQVDSRLQAALIVLTAKETL